MRKILSKQKYQLYLAIAGGAYFIGRIIINLIFNI